MAKQKWIKYSAWDESSFQNKMWWEFFFFMFCFLLLIAEKLNPKLKAMFCTAHRVPDSFFFCLTVVINLMCLLKLICCTLVSQHPFSNIQAKRLFVLLLIAWHQYHEALRKSMHLWRSVVLFQCKCPWGGTDCQAAFLFNVLWWICSDHYEKWPKSQRRSWVNVLQMSGYVIEKIFLKKQQKVCNS